MSAQAWTHAGLATLAAAVWLAVYRLPLRRPRTRQRFRLAVATRTGLPPRHVFPVVGTLIYLAGAGAAVAVVVWVSGPSLGAILPWRLSVDGVIVLALAVLGANAVTAFAMSVVYAVRPTVDVPGAVTEVGWVREILVLPRRWRWIVPMASAAMEELFFRGVLLGGLLAYGAPVWTAIGVAGAVFTAGQVVLTENRLQAVVLGGSSAVLSVIGGLLLAVTGSVLPALIVHATFAGYYTGSSADRASRGGIPARARAY